MINSLNPSIQSFVNALNQIQQNAMTAETEMNTGLRINQVSDAPDQIAPLLQTQAQIAQLNQINTNLGLVQDDTNAAQTALQSAVQVMDQVETLATEGDSSTATADTRSNIASQLQNALTNLVNLANTTSGGKYVFSGDSDQTQSYTVDFTQTNPVSAYQGSASTRKVQIPGGATISTSLTAQQIFDGSGTGDSVFSAVTSLITAMQNNDQAGIDAAIPLVSSSAAYLNQQLATYGTIQDQVNDAVSNGQQQSTQLTAQLSSIQDADMTQVIEQLNQANLQEQAVLGAQAQLPRTSLFSYLG
ncbi:MAG TPA: flagellin [Bryobacteraceae bacterium]|nr:flagellin [Bryobacteraceae bacterium]